MVFMPERASVNQRVQIGAESTIGTVVPASKILECFTWAMGINTDLTEFTPSGHKYGTEVLEDTEWIETSVAGKADYNGLTYLLASAFGAVAPVAHLASTTAKDWKLTPPVTGSVAPQTYTVEQGDSVRAHRTAYGLFTQVGYTVTRKDFSITAKMLSQPIADGITLTANPTSVPLSPAIGRHVNIYLDSTSAGLGTTQLLKVLQLTYSFDGVYGPFWPINRATAGFTAHVDLKPKCTVKLKMEADSVGMGLLTSLQAGSTQYLRVAAQGPVIATDGPGNIPAVFQHDMAVKVGKPSAFADDSGIYAIEWELTVVEDPAWTANGQAQTVTLTNLLSSL